MLLLVLLRLMCPLVAGSVASSQRQQQQPVCLFVLCVEERGCKEEKRRARAVCRCDAADKSAREKEG